MGDIRTSSRALAHPCAVLALVVLVLNDHLLEVDQNDPGWGQTSPSCPTPSTTTVTPNPSNGPPATYEVCV